MSPSARYRNGAFWGINDPEEVYCCAVVAWSKLLARLHEPRHCQLVAAANPGLIHSAMRRKIQHSAAMKRCHKMLDPALSHNLSKLMMGTCFAAGMSCSQAAHVCDGLAFLAQGVYKQVPLDGIWLDMNEISNYCSGDVCTDPGTAASCGVAIIEWHPLDTSYIKEVKEKPNSVCMHAAPE